MLKQTHRPPYKRESFPSECSTKKHLSTCSTVANHLLSILNILIKCKMKVSSIVLLIAAVSSMTTVSARDWKVGDNGLSRWDSNCDFNGRDISCSPASGDQCGGVCIANPSCTHFTHSGGTCCIKRFTGSWLEQFSSGAVCGFIFGRSGQPQLKTIRGISFFLNALKCWTGISAKLLANTF
uniref:Uncharacterized protein n=1 Tax=Daphnia galeata TaxID=27404 RepID=A0A8J2WJX4_9CRUS|nr:unnamed protein product [Daphnia galeata]